MLTIGSSEAVRSYFDNPAVSQSELKAARGGMNAIMDVVDAEGEEKSHALTLGSLVDYMLLGDWTPGIELNTWDPQLFKYSPVEIKVQDSLKPVFKMFKERVKEQYEVLDPDINGYLNELILCLISAEWNAHWKEDTRLKKAIEQLAEPWRLTVENQYVEEFVDTDMWNNAIYIRNRFMGHPDFGWLFDRKTLDKREDVEVFYQLPVYWNYDGSLPAKGLIDIVVRDTRTEKSSLYDLKTIGRSEMEFPRNVLRFRYDIQAQWYMKGYNANYGTNVDSFGFLVGSTDRKRNPICQPVEYQLGMAYIAWAEENLTSLQEHVNRYYKKKELADTVLDNKMCVYDTTPYDPNFKGGELIGGQMVVQDVMPIDEADDF